MRGALFLLSLLAGCSAPPELQLTIRLPADRRLLAAVAQVNLTASRDSVLLAQGSFPATASRLALSGVSHGPRTVISLAGVNPSGVVVAAGRSCPVDFAGRGTATTIYFAPTNFLAATAGPPLQVRHRPVALTLGDGAVLVVGGTDDEAVAFDSCERFAPGAATFVSSPARLLHPRARAEAVELPSIGLLVAGGVDGQGRAIAEAELYLEAQHQFVPVSDARLDARIGHRLVALPDGRALLGGGSAREGGPPVDTTLLLSIIDDGAYQVSRGPPLFAARREHAVTVAFGVPMVFGGYGAAGQPLDSIEAIDVAGSLVKAAPVIARLVEARAEATASLLADSSILVIGGVGVAGAPLASAELFNPITRTTVVHPMASPRRGHTATVLAGGRVLVAGGFDAAGGAIRSVELFVPGVGFVTERPLGTPRAGHIAVPLCDRTVLLVGGGAGAEIYTEPPD